MTAGARARKLRYVTVDILPLRSLVPALFFVSGVLVGYAFALRCADTAGSELRGYYDAYLAARGASPLTAETALRTAACFVRAPTAAFLLGFASIGVFALPLLFLAQGFTLSFSLFSFAAALGREGFVPLAALFAIRLAFVLPCTFLLGRAALEKSRALALLSLGGGRRARPVTYGTAYWYRFAACLACLLLGAALELWLVPLFLRAAA